MITELGIVAGEIWHYLDTRGETSLSSICKAVDRPKTVILMSIGWLAREGHVFLSKKDNDYEVRLR